MILCAYCNSSEKITREHIIPDFVYSFKKELHNNKVVGWNEIAKKMVGGEIVIKDVCKNCNHNLLGRLDSYASQFLREHGFLTEMFLREEIEINYDYVLLSRWLLKLSFNALRQDKSQAHLLSGAVPYILAADTTGMPEIKIVVQLLKPLQHPAEQLASLNDMGLPVSSCGKTNPFIARIGRAVVRGSNEGFVIRTVTMGALIFYIFIFDGSLGEIVREQEVRNFVSNLKEAQILDKDSSSVRLLASPMNWVEANAFSALRAKSFEVKT